MTFLERIKNDREKIRKMPDRKKRLSFIWDYYKFPIIIGVCLLIIIGISISAMISHKDVAMYAVLVNAKADGEKDESIFSSVLEKEGYELGNRVIDINDGLTIGRDFEEEEDIKTMQILNALFTISDLDLFVAPEEVFEKFVEVDGYADLGVLIDRKLLDGYRLYTHENEEGKTVVDGIYLQSGSVLHRGGYYEDEVIIGACINANNLEEAILFIKGTID